MTLDIRPGQVVSIVGRTGSGKSSLLLTLLHLLETEAGQIIIDGLDIARMPRQALRAAIVTIPQDPVEMPGSVRFNLTSFTAASSNQTSAEENEDHAMERSLARVGLWEIVRSRAGGLDGELADVGLSGGQKQLFSLARAIFLVRQHRNKEQERVGGIVLLDEPTSSVDETTGRVMWKTLKEEFAGWTIVAVTHRDEEAGGMDLVVRMDGGKVAAIEEKKTSSPLLSLP